MYTNNVDIMSYLIEMIIEVELKWEGVLVATRYHGHRWPIDAPVSHTRLRPGRYDLGEQKLCKQTHTQQEIIGYQ